MNRLLSLSLLVALFSRHSMAKQDDTNLNNDIITTSPSYYGVQIIHSDYIQTILIVIFSVTLMLIFITIVRAKLDYDKWFFNKSGSFWIRLCNLNSQKDSNQLSLIFVIGKELQPDITTTQHE
jgi:hypothetical protein